MPRLRTTALAAMGAFGLVACGAATEAYSDRSRAWPPAQQPAVYSTPPLQQVVAERPRLPWDSSANESQRIPGGDTCLWWLDKLGIQYRRPGIAPAVETPVEVVGPIDDVDFVTAGKPSLIADCRLVLALHWSAPEFRALGITEVQHSGAYVNRTTRSGKPSLHAQGLAVDVHGVRTESGRFHVKEDFERGLSQTCHVVAPVLNQLECRLRRLRLFRELITPEHDADHHDHLHLGIAALQ